MFDILIRVISHSTFFLWLGFICLILLLLILDLGLFQRKAHAIKMKEAVILTVFWISLALIFNVGIYFYMGSQKAFEFLTGYIVEKALSVDNLFVFLLIFGYFKVEPKYQHKVLFWGIIGALITRGIFIFTGTELVDRFHFVIYIFGGFLIYTAIKLCKDGEEKDIDPGNNIFVKYFSKVVRIKKDYTGSNFFVKENIVYATPLFIVLIVVESTDVMFAFDSVPAVISITTDKFIVYSSNIFAILGLRALYFVISGLMPMFYYLNYGLAIVLGFIGTKMIISDWYHVPTVASLGMVVSILFISIILSVIRNIHKENKNKLKEIET